MICWNHYAEKSRHPKSTALTVPDRRRNTPLKRYRKTPVTIIIGVICKDAIVVASDSQTTEGTAKRMDAEKIRAIPFENTTGILATSGNVALSYRVAEITKSKCVKGPLSDVWQFAENAEAALKEVRTALLEPYAGRPAEELDKLCREYEFSLLLADFHGTEPGLFTIDFPPGVAVKHKRYAAVGCGANIAEFLLKWFDFSKMQLTEAVLTAAFIVGEVKDADSMCGGPTHLRWIKKGKNKVIRFTPEIMSQIETRVKEASSKYKTQWGKSVSDIIAPSVTTAKKPNATVSDD